MLATVLKSLLPNKPTLMPVLRGPFRGARVVMNPQHSLRKIFGLYEHELNNWLRVALCRVNRVVDVGANDGYFTFGSAAAFRRLGKLGEIIAFEPQGQHFVKLCEGVKAQPAGTTRIQLVQSFVGSTDTLGIITLDKLRWEKGDPAARTRALVKIDVEGAEMEVLAGAASWLNSENLFVIEVHKQSFLDEIVQLFAEKGLQLCRVDQHPLRWLNREIRDEQNWWLVSRVD